MPCAWPAPTPSARCAMNRLSGLRGPKALRLGFILAAAAVALSGCVTAVPQSLSRQMLPSSFEGPMATSAEIWPQANWWQNFGDPEMTALIVRAQSQNRDLAIATA